MGVPILEFGAIKKTIIWQDICRKLHGNETNWTERGRASLAKITPPPQLVPPMKIVASPNSNSTEKLRL